MNLILYNSDQIYSYTIIFRSVNHISKSNQDLANDNEDEAYS